jgi:hypothetical protein
MIHIPPMTQLQFEAEDGSQMDERCRTAPSGPAFLLTHAALTILDAEPETDSL